MIGTDQVSKEEYGKQLTVNLEELVNKLKSMSYRSGNLREVKIPKEGKPGETRTLAISNFEDKLIQRMMHKVLESIYEPHSWTVPTGLSREEGVMMQSER